MDKKRLFFYQFKKNNVIDKGTYLEILLFDKDFVVLSYEPGGYLI